MGALEVGSPIKAASTAGQWVTSPAPCFGLICLLSIGFGLFSWPCDRLVISSCEVTRWCVFKDNGLPEKTHGSGCYLRGCFTITFSLDTHLDRIQLYRNAIKNWLFFPSTFVGKRKDYGYFLTSAGPELNSVCHIPHSINQFKLSGTLFP